MRVAAAEAQWARQRDLAGGGGKGAGVVSDVVLQWYSCCAQLTTELGACWARPTYAAAAHPLPLHPPGEIALLARGEADAGGAGVQDLAVRAQLVVGGGARGAVKGLDGEGGRRQQVERQHRHRRAGGGASDGGGLGGGRSQERRQQQQCEPA